MIYFLEDIKMNRSLTIKKCVQNRNGQKLTGKMHLEPQLNWAEDNKGAKIIKNNTDVQMNEQKKAEQFKRL